MPIWLSFAASLLVAIVLPACSRGQAIPPTLASCAWVRAENDAAGAGFVVDAKRKLLVTCRHLVADRTNVTVLFPWIRDGELVVDRREYLGQRPHLRELGLLTTGKVVARSDALDLALVEVESLPVSSRAVTFARQPPMPGEPLSAFGNRLDLDTVLNLSAGSLRVSGALADGYFWRGQKLAAGASIHIAQLPIEEGDSGGPVFNTRGELIGMAAALRRQCPEAAVVIAAGGIRSFAGLPEPDPPPHTRAEPPALAEALTRGTVWVQPTATDIQRAGALVDANLVLTCGKGLRRGDRTGVAFPIRAGDRWLSERAAYKDPVALALQGCWRGGVVAAVDPDCDLALIRLDSTPEFCRPLKLATRTAGLGSRVHAMNHPCGLEFAWVYAAGVVRQAGAIAIVPGDHARRVNALVCQLPSQSQSPGGPVINEAGELVGILAAKESAQQVGYAVSSREIADFLDVASTDRPARTVAGLLARLVGAWERLASALALGLAGRAEASRAAGRLDEAERDCLQALTLDPGCTAARLCRSRMLGDDAANAELDRAIEAGPFDRTALRSRAALCIRTRDWRKARGDLDRLLAVDPLNAEARRLLIGVLLALNEDDKAIAAVSDTLRADPKRLPALASELLAQADALESRFPQAPGIAGGWLVKALTAAEKATSGSAARRPLAEALSAASTVTDEGERLRVLRARIEKLAGK